VRDRSFDRDFDRDLALGDFAKDMPMDGMHMHSSEPFILRSIMQSIENGLPILAPLSPSPQRSKRHLNAVLLCSLNVTTVAGTARQSCFRQA
jgi:hypothetical protein